LPHGFVWSLRKIDPPPSALVSVAIHRRAFTFVQRVAAIKLMRPFLFVSLLCFAPAVAVAQDATPVAPATPPAPQTPAETATLETVLVTGEQPGPGLWKISRGDHVLWILGAQYPLPKKMTWRGARRRADDCGIAGGHRRRDAEAGTELFPQVDFDAGRLRGAQE
jgi:hypothetical protein